MPGSQPPTAVSGASTVVASTPPTPAPTVTVTPLPPAVLDQIVAHVVHSLQGSATPASGPAIPAGGSPASPAAPGTSSAVSSSGTLVVRMPLSTTHSGYILCLPPLFTVALGRNPGWAVFNKFAPARGRGRVGSLGCAVGPSQPLARPSSVALPPPPRRGTWFDGHPTGLPHGQQAFWPGAIPPPRGPRVRFAQASQPGFHAWIGTSCRPSDRVPFPRREDLELASLRLTNRFPHKDRHKLPAFCHSPASGT